MTLHRTIARKILLPIAEAVMGRRNLVRLGRFISMEARLDGANHMSSNGELMVQECVLRCHRSGKLVAFDVGANIGDWTQALFVLEGKQAMGNQASGKLMEVHLFEPASQTFQQLSKNLAATGDRAVLVNEALSDKPGSGEFVILGSGCGINSFHADRASAASVERVRLNTVDRYCQQQSIRHIDLMKIDAEGHDMAVMEGARSMLAAHSISVIQFEYNQRWIESRHLLKDAFELLQPLGYQIGKVTPRGIEFYSAWHFELESYREANYLACLPEAATMFPRIKWWNAK